MNHDRCNERIEKLAYLAAGLRREHHARCGTEHVVCFRCLAIEEYELDRVDMADQRRVSFATTSGIADAAVDAAQKLLSAMNEHPSSQNVIGPVVDEILGDDA